MGVYNPPEYLNIAAMPAPERSLAICQELQKLSEQYTIAELKAAYRKLREKYTWAEFELRRKE